MASYARCCGAWARLRSISMRSSSRSPSAMKSRRLPWGRALASLRPSGLRWPVPSSSSRRRHPSSPSGSSCTPSSPVRPRCSPPWSWTGSQTRRAIPSTPGHPSAAPPNPGPPCCSCRWRSSACSAACWAGPSTAAWLPSAGPRRDRPTPWGAAGSCSAAASPWWPSSVRSAGPSPWSSWPPAPARTPASSASSTPAAAASPRSGCTRSRSARAP
mmetsp:Transcript_90921/g.271414  ORF Transcript_90921/g.271414 Transcript_90921/m.271414 type:complete len:215 (-) Transcript_90921:1830-2474(-)